VRDRHARGPVVHDTPSLNIVFDGATDARPRFVLYEKIVGQNAEFSVLMTVIGAKGVRSRHAHSIARTADKRNSPILRSGALGIIAGHASRLALGEVASPRNTSTAWLSRRISSSSNRPTRAPTLVLGTVVILSTIRRHAARRPLRWFGSTAKRNSGASVS